MVKIIITKLIRVGFKICSRGIRKSPVEMLNVAFFDFFRRFDSGDT